jgi:isopentenyl phosphate kinase
MNQTHPGLLQFVKWGGSLITDKNSPSTARPDVLTRLAGELAEYFHRQPTARVVLGHGSGSFGHVPARRFHTRHGVHSPEEWLGFLEVWRQAASLNRLVMDGLQQAGLPAIALQPSAAVLANNGKVFHWDVGPLQAALQAGLLPVVYGDVIFDNRQGGTILSTEDLFDYLVPQLQPARVLLAGLEAGVWADYPACTRLVHRLFPDDLPAYEEALQGSSAPDVTGGMSSKVRQALKLVKQMPGLEVLIFSGSDPGVLLTTLLGEPAGTRLAAR